ARRLAMLREMGLRLLPPLQAPPSAPETTDAPAAVRVSAQPQRMQPPNRPPSNGDDGSGEEAVAREGAADLASLGWDELRAAARDFATRDGSSRRVVFGVGPQRADWMVIGEAPGEAEEQQGEPFAGPVGKLLDGMLRAMGLEPARDVYVTNLLKCRPPGDRNPDPEELAAWEPFLRREVALVRPRMLLVMGRFAVPRLLRTQEPIGRLRGRAHAYDGVPVVVTYHPAYLLRNLPDKAKAWADLCLAQDLLAGDQAPASGR
ncbi:MAG: uracil-DNA glycosylase, partial [Ramlibacter sp.]